jgi:chorismate dehydratase
VIRISVVKYLNAVPLAWGILEGPNKDHFDAVFSTPAECAEQLASGAVDIGLIPSIAYQRIPGCRIIPGPAVASPRRALSVFLLSVLPLFRVKTVGYDPASRTSEALARIVFGEYYGIHPEFRPADPDPAVMLRDNDAALLIGDAALQYQAANRLPNASREAAWLRAGPEPIHTFDLAERWNRLTGLPFVFAFWAARRGFSDPDAQKRLLESRAFGLANLDGIASRYAEELNLDVDFVKQYLDVNLDYHMDAAGVEALGVFFELAAKHGALKGVRRMEFL